MTTSSNGWQALDHHDQHKKLITGDGTTVSASRYIETDVTEIVHYEPTTGLWTVLWLRQGLVHGVGQHRLQKEAQRLAQEASYALWDAGRPAVGLSRMAVA